MRHFFRIGGVVAAWLVFGSVWADVRGQDLMVVGAGQGAKRLKVTNSTGSFDITSPTFTTLTSTTVQVPAAFNQARIVARFSAESNCLGGSSSYCSLRILVDGVEMNPAAGLNYAFDSPGDVWSGNSVGRTSGILLSGAHTVTVEGAIVGRTEWVLDDWQLTLEVWQVS